MRRPLWALLALALPILAGADVVNTTSSGSGGHEGFTGGVVTNLTTFGTAADAANTIRFNSVTGCIEFEGSAADAHESSLCVANPSGDVTLTLPATTGTVALLGAQTFTGAQTYSALGTFNAGATFNTTTVTYNVPQTFGTSGSSLAGTTALADNVATAVVRVSVAQGAGTGGILQWDVFCTDATDHQSYSGQIYFSAVNKAGTETCTDPTIIGTALLSASSGTLTCTYACDETPTDAVDITLNCNTSLNVALTARWQMVLMGPGTITAQ